jgi:hypothetical protein
MGTQYTIGKFLKYKYQKWAFILNMDFQTKSLYSQKKVEKSNWQLDSQPLKLIKQGSNDF